MKTKIAIFNIAMLIVTSHASESPKAKPKAECTSPGASCLDCWTSLNCVDIGNGEFIPQIQTCAMGRSCRDESGVCEASGNYQCSTNLHIPCNSEGTFADPFDGRNYFICVQRSEGGFDKYERQCNLDRSFSPFTKECNVMQLKSTPVISSVAICYNDTQVGTVDANRNHYFRCVRMQLDIGYNYIPQLFSCPSNFYFDGTTCVDPFSLGLDEDGRCTGIGRFYTTQDCHFYNDCKSIGDYPTYTNCSIPIQFDPFTKSCKMPTCKTCQL